MLQIFDVVERAAKALKLSSSFFYTIDDDLAGFIKFYGYPMGPYKLSPLILINE